MGGKRWWYFFHWWWLFVCFTVIYLLWKFPKSWMLRAKFTKSEPVLWFFYLVIHSQEAWYSSRHGVFKRKMEEDLCLVLITQPRNSSLDQRAAWETLYCSLCVCWRHPWQHMNQTNCNSHLVMKKKNDICVLLN